MKSEEINRKGKTEELPDAWWYRVYFAVIITTVLVISALGYFSYFFSK